MERKKQNNLDTVDQITEFCTFVNNQIEQLKKYEILIHDHSIQLQDINFALGSNLKVVLALNAYYQILLSQYNILEKKFQIWWDEKFSLASQFLNPPDLPGSKYKGIKEIESYVRFNNKDEYIKKTDELDKIKLKMNFIKSLKDDWSGNQYSLKTLSDNLKAELVGTYAGKDE